MRKSIDFGSPSHFALNDKNRCPLLNNKNLIGSIQSVLVDGPSKKDENVFSGYTEGNKLVNFVPKNAKTGMIVQVKITSANTWTLKGEEISS